MGEIERIHFARSDRSEFTKNLTEIGFESRVLLPSAGDTQSLLRKGVRDFCTRDG